MRYAIYMPVLMYNHVSRTALNAVTRFRIVLALKQWSILTQRIQLRGGLGMVRSKKAHHSMPNQLGMILTYL